jgi:hypothetical protein
MPAGSKDDPSASGDRPAYLDSSLSQEQMADALEHKFCVEPLSVQELRTGYSFGSCTAPTLGRYVFHIFDSPEELDAYLDEGHCEDGFYYARGPTWLAAAVTPKDKVRLTAAGGTSITCN